MSTRNPPSRGEAVDDLEDPLGGQNLTRCGQGRPWTGATPKCDNGFSSWQLLKLITGSPPRGAGGEGVRPPQVLSSCINHSLVVMYLMTYVLGHHQSYHGLLIRPFRHKLNGSHLTEMSHIEPANSKFI